MSEFQIQLQEKGRCRIRHAKTDAEIVTDLPPEYGGQGRSFSSTDLVSAALGSCILSTIDTIFEREGHDPKKIAVKVTKRLSDRPKMIRSIDVEISYPDALSDLFLKKAGRAMNLCPVKRSLNESIEIRTRFTTRSAGYENAEKS